jgi:hypothetical protein
MAKHDTDPVLEQLVHAVNESGQTRVPVTVSAHGTVLTGVLIAQEAYFTQLAGSRPLLSALQPASGLLGKEYAKEVSAEGDHHLHIRAKGAHGEAVWRISLDAVDGWTLSTAGEEATLSAAGEEAQDDRGPFARLLGT